MSRFRPRLYLSLLVVLLPLGAMVWLVGGASIEGRSTQFVWLGFVVVAWFVVGFVLTLVAHDDAEGFL